MRLRIVAAGRVREPYLRAGVDDYLARLRRYLPVDEIEVRTGHDRRALRAWRGALPDRHELWALDASGEMPTSADLAGRIKERMDHGTAGLCFAIGGADGLPAEVRDRAGLRLSLSRLTLPHRLARLLLAEQLYRSMTIIRGEPYDR